MDAADDDQPAAPANAPSAWPARALGFAAGATGAVVLAGHWDPHRVVHGASWIAIGMALVPALMTALLGLVAAVLSVLLALLALPWWARGRPTGLGEVLAAAWRLPVAVVPGYLQALRRARRPALWSALCGVVAGAAWVVATGGLLELAGRS